MLLVLEQQDTQMMKLHLHSCQFDIVVEDGCSNLMESIALVVVTADIAAAMDCSTSHLSLKMDEVHRPADWKVSLPKPCTAK